MRQTNTQTTAPATRRSVLKDDDQYHYVFVENKDHVKSGWETPLHTMLDKQSLTNPDELMYEIASEDRKVTGSNNMTALRMSQADYKAMVKATGEASGAAVEETTNSADGNSFEGVKQTGAISLD